jgi:psiF repeat
MKGRVMKSLLVVVAITLFASTAAFAANPSCEAQAAEKKLAGAAKSSFIKKCDKDAAEAATTACTTQATEKKLAGAAQSSFMKKCVKDATTAAK